MPFTKSGMPSPFTSPMAGAQPDDFLDATIATVTAQRIYLGTAERIPLKTEFDGKGLRMEMVY
jgi:predicted RNase H-like nuclease